VRRKKQFTLPLAVIGGMAPLALETYKHGRDNGWAGAGDTGADYFVRSLTGYSPNRQGYGGSFNARNMIHGTLPIGLGILIHKLANSMGVNRLLARSGIPIIRI
jgi:hypothetical protein